MVDARIRGHAKRLFVWLFVLAFLAVVAGLLWAGTPFHGTDASVEGVLADDRIDVDRAHGNYVLRPADAPSQTGLVFYPGGRVHPDAYLSSLSPLVREENATVVVVNMPLNLAVLNQGAADSVVARYPGIDEWYVGGHSLGGAMACRYAGANPDQVVGLLLFASYCDRSIADTGLRVLAVTGDGDTVLDRTAFEQNLGNLPATATIREIGGVNHTQFGSYTGQSGDTPTGTAYAVAHRRLANVTVPWFRTASR